MNRRERRAQKKVKAPSYHRLTIEERQEKLMKNGITPEDLKRSYENGYRHGFAEASPATFKIIYAAVCLTLNEMHGFGMKRCRDVLNAVDACVVDHLTSAEAIEAVYKKIGLEIDFGETLDERVKERETA